MKDCTECVHGLVEDKRHICEYCIDDCFHATSKTYGDLLNSFKEKYPSLANEIVDYRPCMEPYFGYYIPGAIIVWLKNGGKVLYISENLIVYPKTNQKGPD